jgi:dGTPase
MDGVMKYKTLRNQTPAAPNHFIYDDQSDCVDFIFGGRPIPVHLTPGENLNAFQSIECQIMDWADDTAYRLNDVVDGVNAGFINKLTVEQWAASAKLTSVESTIVDKLLTTMTRGVLTRDFSIKIGNFVRACKLVERDNFMSDITNRYRYELRVSNFQVRSEHELYKRLATEVVFNSPQLHQLEFKGKNMIRSIFRAFAKNYVAAIGKSMLLPREVDVLIRRTKNQGLRARLLCDQLAGMTDDFATRTYRRLFDPTYGSMVDLV